MTGVQYFVTRHKGQWAVSLKDVYSGPYATEQEAIGVAVESAHKQGQAGNDAEVIVQGHDKRFRSEWVYGRDPYPSG
ncbi:hypothetical protein GGD62_008405 [Bradyrhizobium sp. ERR14]|nr:hypothetical protein [Bradyrhizobium sp. ERR14]